VTVARSNGDMTAIAKGLDAGMHVVVEGQAQLIDGATVREDFGGAKAATADGIDQNATTGAVE